MSVGVLPAPEVFLLVPALLVPLTLNLPAHRQHLQLVLKKINKRGTPNWLHCGSFYKINSNSIRICPRYRDRSQMLTDKYQTPNPGWFHVIPLCPVGTCAGFSASCCICFAAAWLGSTSMQNESKQHSYASIKRIQVSFMNAYTTSWRLTTSDSAAMIWHKGMAWSKSCSVARQASSLTKRPKKDSEYAKASCRYVRTVSQAGPQHPEPSHRALSAGFSIQGLDVQLATWQRNVKCQ